MKEVYALNCSDWKHTIIKLKGQSFRHVMRTGVLQRSSSGSEWIYLTTSISIKFKSRKVSEIRVGRDRIEATEISFCDGQYLDYGTDVLHT